VASVVDICNTALSHLGEEAEVIQIAPPDGTTQSVHCGRFYPIARDQLLEMHPWTFATVRVSLALVAAGAPSEWAYAYALPTKCLKPHAVYRPDGLDDAEGEDFIVESASDGNSIVYTNVPEAVLRYTRLVEDTTKFTPGFVMALARLLASLLAGPIVKGTTGIQVAQSHMKFFAVELASAKTQDSNTGQRSNYKNRLSSTETARGGPRWSNWRNGEGSGE
jgi:hypothetical protein